MAALTLLYWHARQRPWFATFVYGHHSFPHGDKEIEGAVQMVFLSRSHCAKDSGVGSLLTARGLDPSNLFDVSYFQMI